MKVLIAFEYSGVIRDAFIRNTSTIVHRLVMQSSHA